MNKNKWILTAVILIVILVSTAFFFWKNNNSENNKNYEASKTSQSQNVGNSATNTDNSTKNENNNKGDNKNSASENLSSTDTTKNITKGSTTPQPLEEQIASFSTKIYTKDSARQNNISITCQALNDTIVENGAIFSFCNTVGPATSAKGYQKADIFDNKGQKKKALGGGNCQISTTLYNAILSVTSLVVTERHEHSNKVPYIQSGKDAAVAYGSYDLKFRNNSGNKIKIRAESNSSSVTVTLLSIK